MSRCIQLAKNGLGTTYPNPLVGSVIVHDNLIIGEGWHHSAGLPHAEVNAIRSVTDESLLKNSTIYVNLEPCSHYGKTPPCADLIITSGIKKVVIGSLDPNPKVAGKGVQKLTEAGCDVSIGILEPACDELNKRFFTYHRKRRPFIFLKWAQTLDGFIAPDKKNRSLEKKPVWITNEYSRQLVHKLRAQEQAILVGITTIMDDNPSLTARDWFGASPIKIVLDRELSLPKDASVFDKAAKTIVITEKTAKNEPNITFESVDFSENLAQQICDILYVHSIQSVIIEGGAKTIQTFIDSNLWDEAHVYIGSTTFEEGLKAPLISSGNFSEENIKNDQFQSFINKTI